MNSFCLFPHHFYFNTATEKGYVEMYTTDRKKVDVQTVLFCNLFETLRKCELIRISQIDN